MKVVCLLPEVKRDYMASMVVEGLYKNGIEYISNSTSNGSNNAHKEYEILTQINFTLIDAVLLVWGKEGPGYLDYLNEMGEKIRKIAPNMLFIYIDGSEWSYTGSREVGQGYDKRRGQNWINQYMHNNRIDWYLKRELYPQDPAYFTPFLFAAMDESVYKKQVTKDIDLFCSFGHELTGLRKEVTEICKKLKSEGYNVVIGQNYTHDEFLELTARSFVSVDAWGGGDCNMRLFEIIANKTCCIYQKYNILTGPHWFEEGEHVVSYKSAIEFENKVRLLLKDKEKCVEIGRKGFDHLIKYHTSEARVKQILKLLI